MLWLLIIIFFIAIIMVLFGYEWRLPMPRRARLFGRRFWRFLARLFARIRNMRNYFCYSRREWYFAMLTCIMFASALICISHSLLVGTKYVHNSELFNNVCSVAGLKWPPSSANVMSCQKFLGSQAANAARPLKRPDTIKFPFSLRLMPHLQRDNSLRPAFELNQKRPLAEYIIGVPHVKRENETYLYGTIQLLMDKLSEAERNTTMIVIMVAETDMKYVVEVAHNIERLFSQELSEGLIQLIAPNKNFYPNLDNLPPSLNDSPERTRWRTKQNLDVVYLMAYSESKCFYYLMLEDDVMASEQYMTHIRNFTERVTTANPNWFFIQFSTTGGIGKLFQTTKLVHFITFVQLLYRNMPIDWLTETYVGVLTCELNKKNKACAKAKAKIRPTYKTNLFTHLGRFSSLKGKIHKVKDTGTIPPYFPHKNPPLKKIVCAPGSHRKNTIEMAYEGTTYYWGKKPRIGDVIEFWFKQPIKLGRYLLRTGNMAYNNRGRVNEAVVEVLPSIGDGKFKTVGKFDEFGIAEGFLDGYKYGNVLAFRIRFIEDSNYWIMITEIEFASVHDELEKKNARNSGGVNGVSAEVSKALKNEANRLMPLLNLFG